MSRNKSDYKKNQGSGLRTGHEQLHLNQEIDLPFFGHLDEAIKRHEEKIRIPSKVGDRVAVKVGDRVAVGCTYGNLGYVDYKRGHYEEAKKHFKESLKIAEDEGNKAWILNLQCCLGNVYDNLGEYESEKTCYKKARDIVEEKDKDLRVLINGNLGNALANLGDFTTAEMYHREQLEIATEIKDKSARVRANYNLGRD